MQDRRIARAIDGEECAPALSMPSIVAAASIIAAALALLADVAIMDAVWGAVSTVPLWEGGVLVIDRLSADDLAVARPVIAGIVFILAGAALAKEFVLKDKRVSLLINLAHWAVLGILWALGLEVLFTPFIWVLG